MLNILAHVQQSATLPRSGTGWGLQVHGRTSTVDVLQAILDTVALEASKTDQNEGPVLAITLNVDIDDTDGEEVDPQVPA